MALSYQCCICKKPMSTTGENTHSLDPCSLVLFGHADREWREQKEQTFYCHIECFRRIVNDGGVMQILEPDYSTHGEIEDEQQCSGT